jgi:predicted nucleic acid-binding protein
MPVLNYLADTNCISDFFRGEKPVREWFSKHQGEIGVSTITLAEIRRGIELKTDGKTRRQLERDFGFLLEDYHDAIFVFDEAGAMEWGTFMAENKDALPPYDDSLIAAIARSCDLVVITRNQKHFPGCKSVNPWESKPPSG